MIDTVEINASFIHLTQNKVAIVDTEDYDYLNQWKWHTNKHKNTSYASRNQHLGCFNGKQKQKRIMMHRLITNASKDFDVDHVNGNGLDNRKCNLRAVSRRQNGQNQKHRQNKTSKYPGVCWHKRNKKWEAGIMINGKRKYLGAYNDELEAAKSYEKALRKEVGEELICKEGK